MPRLPRSDTPGAWFHIMNRAIARRTAFESRADTRYFLSRVAYAVRRNEIEVHVYCVMATHFHILARSPSGRISEAMRRIQNEYVRYFNRTRRRDGPLFRGRFRSQRVTSDRYRAILVRYIDNNPVAANVAPNASSYPHGSAHRLAIGRPPRWLATAWLLGPLSRLDADAMQRAYLSAWGQPLTDAERSLVELRALQKPRGPDPLDDLVGTAPRAVRDWMTRKAMLADATAPGMAIVPPASVLEEVLRIQAAGRSWTYRSREGQRRNAWHVAIAGLLRHVSGLTYSELANVVRASPAMASRRVKLHASLCANEAYVTRWGRIAAICIAKAHR